MTDRIKKNKSQPQIVKSKLKTLQRNNQDGEINWTGKQRLQLKLQGVTLNRTLRKSQGLKSRIILRREQSRVKLGICLMKYQ